MARTPEARALTARNALVQDRLGAGAARAVSHAWGSTMRADDIDAGRRDWISRAVAETTARAREATDRAASYLERYAAAEGHPSTVVVPASTSVTTTAEALTVNGPITYKSLLSRGLDPAHALAVARTRASAAARGIVMGAGRRTVNGTARRNRGYWRRVTDGKPCVFCAMLAARGPVYAEDTVDFETHDHCGCTSEISYETPEIWARDYATDDEIAWINAYYRAADVARQTDGIVVAPVMKRGDRRDTVLWRMRRQSPTLFSDGVHPRT